MMEVFVTVQATVQYLDWAEKSHNLVQISTNMNLALGPGL